MSRPNFTQLLTKFLQQRAGGFPGASAGGSGGQGAPKLGQALGGVGGIVLLAAAGLTVNNALFNGECAVVGSEYLDVQPAAGQAPEIHGNSRC